MLCTLVIASTTVSSPLPRGAGQHVVRQADVLRSVLGVPHQLLGERVLRIEVQIAEQALLRPKLDAADDAQPVLIVARRERMALRMVDVDLRAFVQADGLGERVLLIAAAVPRTQAQQLDAANDARRPVDAQPLVARIDKLLQQFRHENPLERLALCAIKKAHRKARLPFGGLDLIPGREPGSIRYRWEVVSYQSSVLS